MSRPPSEVVPYGSAYGLENVRAQRLLETSAIVCLDHAMHALIELNTTSDLREVYAEHVHDHAARDYLLRCADADAEQEMAVADLPEIYAHRYRTRGFLKDWVVTMTLVGWKLAQPEALPLTNVAEELALHLILENAIAGLDLVDDLDAAAKADVEAALSHLYDDAFEDNDFLELYSLDDSDEIADLDPAHQLGITDLRFKQWFEPFGSGVERGVPHPFLLDS